MSCGCTSSMDGTSEAGYMDSFQGETPAFKPDLNFADIEDLEDKMSFVNNDEGEFDNFLTKKLRERRSVRKGLVKGGLSKKEAKAQALAQVPKGKLGSLISNALKGTTDVITDEVIQSSQEGVAVGTSVPTGSGGVGSSDDLETPNPKYLKPILIIGGVAVLLVGGYFAFGKKLGIRK